MTLPKSRTGTIKQADVGLPSPPRPGFCEELRKDIVREMRQAIHRQARGRNIDTSVALSEAAAWANSRGHRSRRVRHTNKEVLSMLLGEKGKDSAGAGAEEGQ